MLQTLERPIPARAPSADAPIGGGVDDSAGAFSGEDIRAHLARRIRSYYPK